MPSVLILGSGSRKKVELSGVNGHFGSVTAIAAQELCQKPNNDVKNDAHYVGQIGTWDWWFELELVEAIPTRYKSCDLRPWLSRYGPQKFLSKVVRSDTRLRRAVASGKNQIAMRSMKLRQGYPPFYGEQGYECYECLWGVS
ncbi:hypothetical protein B0H14DRAFT_2601946 [Mycena olivaceomarginata]|nr:hypothetical protein B0H14DRAFT_2601946 [Mycena olivaceomarginata]